MKILNTTGADIDAQLVDGTPVGLSKMTFVNISKKILIDIYGDKTFVKDLKITDPMKFIDDCETLIVTEDVARVMKENNIKFDKEVWVNSNGYLIDIECFEKRIQELEGF